MIPLLPCARHQKQPCSWDGVRVGAPQRHDLDGNQLARAAAGVLLTDCWAHLGTVAGHGEQRAVVGRDGKCAHACAMPRRLHAPDSRCARLAHGPRLRAQSDTQSSAVHLWRL